MACTYHHKIVELSTLLDRVRHARRDGKTVVQCHGCFDIVHPGHVRYLQFARQLGDLLVVTITADAAISKRATGPYIPQELRAENLAALEGVDCVYVDPSPTAESVLDAIRPNVYVKGAEYAASRDPGFLREREVVESYGGRVIFSSGEPVFSSTNLIQSLLPDPQLEAERQRMVRRRHRIDAPTLLSAVDRFANLRVAVVGDVVLDRYVFCDAVGLASEVPVLSLARLRDELHLGGAAIVARHVAALGARADLFSAVAPDAASRQMADTLRQESVRCHLYQARPALVEKTRFLVEENKILQVESGAKTPLDSQTERDATRELQAIIPELDAVIFCDFGYGMVTAGLLNRVLPSLRNHGPVTAGDVSGSRGNLLAYQGFDLLCPSERELRATLHDLDRGLSSVAYDLMDRTQSKRMIVTLGKRGLVTFQRRSAEPTSPEWSGRLLSEHLPALPAVTVDPLGCGDALLAVAALGLTAGLSLMQSAWLGHAAAALEGAQVGNVPMHLEGLRRQILSGTESPPAVWEPHPVGVESPT